MPHDRDAASPSAARAEKTSISAEEAVGIEVIQDLSQVSSPIEGFLRRHRLRAKTLLSNGLRTDTYVVDYVDRAPGRRDAVAIGIFAPDPGGDPGQAMVLLRRQARLPVFLSTTEVLSTEVVAGIIEAPESPIEATCREVFEETGLRIDGSAVRSLGPPVFASPGTLTERFFPMLVELAPGALDGAEDLAPMGDGSAMEEGAVLIVTSLDVALCLTQRVPAIAEGTVARAEDICIQDAKTELVLSRLDRWLRTEAPRFSLEPRRNHMVAE